MCNRCEMHPNCCVKDYVLICEMLRLSHYAGMQLEVAKQLQRLREWNRSQRIEGSSEKKWSTEDVLREEVADRWSIWLGHYVAERRDCSEKQIAQSRSSWEERYINQRRNRSEKSRLREEAFQRRHLSEAAQIISSWEETGLKALADQLVILWFNHFSWFLLPSTHSFRASQGQSFVCSLNHAVVDSVKHAWHWQDFPIDPSFLVATE